jgi:hypothetical protein
MAENTNLTLTVEAWADIVIKEWLNKMDALSVGNTGTLAESFEKQVITETNGDPRKIRFLFEWYGRMVDYGVGVGVDIENRKEMVAAGKTTRKKKQWYTSVFYKQLAVLRHLLEEKTAKQIEKIITVNMSELNSEGLKNVRRHVNPRDKFTFNKYARIRGRQ